MLFTTEKKVMLMRQKILATLIAATLLLLAACSGNSEINEGYVCREYLQIWHRTHAEVEAELPLFDAEGYRINYHLTYELTMFGQVHYFDSGDTVEIVGPVDAYLAIDIGETEACDDTEMTTKLVSADTINKYAVGDFIKFKK